MLCACGADRKPEPAAKVVKTPKALPDPDNKFDTSTECTPEIARRLNPEETRTTEQEIRSKAQAAQDELSELATDVKDSFKLLRGKVKRAPKDLPILKNNRFPPVPLVLSRSTNVLEGSQVLVTRPADGRTYWTCKVKESSWRKDAVTQTVTFSGRPQDLAGLIASGLDNPKTDHANPDVDVQYRYYHEGKFIPYGKFDREEGSLYDPIVELLKKLVANRTALRLSGPWIRTAIRTLNESQRNALNRRLTELWQASGFDWETFDEEIKYDEEDEDDTESFAKDNPMQSMLYRRAIASKADADMIRIYRIWLAVFAHDIEGDEAALWIHDAQDDLAKLGADKKFYEELLGEVVAATDHDKAPEADDLPIKGANHDTPLKGDKDGDGQLSASEHADADHRAYLEGVKRAGELEDARAKAEGDQKQGVVVKAKRCTLHDLPTGFAAEIQKLMNTVPEVKLEMLSIQGHCVPSITPRE